ncbi:hypothetical protein GCM10020256_42220 [Streptomyces thermocoprophilus]
MQERLRRATKLPPRGSLPARRLGQRHRTHGRPRLEPRRPRGDPGPCRGRPHRHPPPSSSPPPSTPPAASSATTPLTWPSGRTALIDLAVRTRRGDPFAISDLDSPGWLERFTAQDRTLAPRRRAAHPGPDPPLAPHEKRADGIARAEHLLDLGFPGWRDRLTWRREATANGRTGAVDLPGTTWRDRPAIDRGDGVYLAGDQVAAPGVLSEVSFNSAVTAVSLALGHTADLDLKHA